jgi:transcription antitermination factor NusG
MSETPKLPSLTALRERVEGSKIMRLGIERAPLDPAASWFAAQTNPQCEVRVMHGVAALGWEVFVPFGWKWARPRHAPSDLHVLRRRPGMPGYVFFAAPRDARGDIRISEVRSVQGLKGIVSQGLTPLRLQVSAVEKLRHAEAAGAYDFNGEPPRGKLWDLQEGDLIKVTVGPCTGWIATVRRRSNAAEVEVLDEVFGARLTVRLDHLIPVVLDGL